MNLISLAKQETSELPLVSIVVVTYNSARYVTETLESAKSQSYQKMELVISDDASTDNTVDLCKNWVNLNQNSFTRTLIVTSASNTGVAANLNRGINAASGEWIKTIAGDDLLINDCISKYVEYICKNKCNVVAAKRYSFYNNNPNDFKDDENHSFFNHKSISARQQYQFALRGIGAPHNTWFVRTAFLLNIGLYDETIPMAEDWPMKLKVLRMNEKIYYLDEYTVLYRINTDSVSRNLQKIIYNKWTVDTYIPVKKKFIYPHLPLDEKVVMKYDILLMKLIYYSFLNHFNVFNRAFNFALRWPVTFLNKHFIRRVANKILMEIQTKIGNEGILTTEE